MEESKLEAMLKGNTPENKKQNAAEFVAPGGRGINDYSLEAPGFANNLRAAAEAQKRTVELIPVVVTQTMESHCDRVQEVLDSSLARMESTQRQATKQKLPFARSFCRTSAALGLMAGFLVAIGIAWFWVIPAQVAYQRGSDWAIGEYLATPEGKAVRNHFRCKTRGCKKSVTQG